MPENHRHLFHQIATGDEKAFNRVYLIYYKVIYTNIKRTVRNKTITEDIVQDTFIKLWNYREQLPEIDNPGGWLYRTAINSSFSYVRWLGVVDRVSGKMDVPDIVCGYESMNRKELIQADLLLQKGIMKLPRQQRRIVDMLINDCLNRKQIAKELGISEHTVKNHYAAAIDSLREYMENQGSNRVPMALLMPFSIFF